MIIHVGSDEAPKTHASGDVCGGGVRGWMGGGVCGGGGGWRGNYCQYCTHC